jgi:hypothetical protein
VLLLCSALDKGAAPVLARLPAWQCKRVCLFAPRCGCYKYREAPAAERPWLLSCLLCNAQVSNLLLAGGLTHRWYKKHFKAYPKSRMAIVPFIY